MHLCRFATALLLGAGFTIGACSSASAAVVLFDNFDTYANQAAFEGAWTPIGTTAPLSAELSTAQSVSPTQSIRAPGTATNAQSRNERIFAETSTLSSSGNLGIGDTLSWSFDFYDRGTTLNAAPQRNYSNLQDTAAGSSTNQLISMGLNNNQGGADSGGQYFMAHILGFTPSGSDPDGGAGKLAAAQTAGAYFKLNDFSVGLRNAAAEWRNLKVIVSTDNGTSTDYAFYVDGVLAERVDNVGTAASIRSYERIRIGSGLGNGSTEAFFDNVRLEYVVPEPACLSVLGLGALLATRRPR